MNSSLDNATTRDIGPTPGLYALVNKNGLSMSVTNFGGRIMSLRVPDNRGILDDIVLGYDSASEYPGGNPYFGAIIGRVGNRIAKGRFSLGGKEYSLSINNGSHSLHGGPSGFHNVYWTVKGVTKNSLELHYRSRDKEEGYPGNLDVVVIYTLTDTNELAIDYAATTDQPTPVNLTHHSYYNLAGDAAGDVYNHEIMIAADSFTPVDAGLIPTGERRKVKGTPFDFTTPRLIGSLIDDNDEQLRIGKGYDHNWILNKKNGEVSFAARVTEPSSGRIMEVWTTEPGMQFYSGNFLNGQDVGKNGKAYPYRGALCLEAQHFPDSPNQPGFPSIVIEPGEKYLQRTVYKFLTKETSP